MPELPEVETVVRTLAPHVLGHVFSGVNLFLPATLHPQSLPLESLIGLRISGARRRGKLAILDLQPVSQIVPNPAKLPQYLIFHLRMTGRLSPKNSMEQKGKHTRCVFGLTGPTGDESQLFFDDVRTFGKIFAANDERLAAWSFWSSLGPEPLDLEASCFAERLRGGRAIKTALLDQKVIAGIGNIYADEALFKARLNPNQPAGSLKPKECARLLSALQDVLHRSIEQCGSSIRDYRDANGNVGAFQNSFAVYGRGGKKCRKCGGILKKIRLGGRATVFCPSCQK